MAENFYSIRMHAARDGAHHSGAERIARTDGVQKLAADMVGRALRHERGAAERIELTVEALEPAAIRSGRLPDLTTVAVADFEQGRRAAHSWLVEAGVSATVASSSIERIARGPAPDGGTMRGAMLIDVRSGARREHDPFRGVRATRMDITPEAEAGLRRLLAPRGLDNLHVREALVLAAKVLAAPGIVAELCWSDDPDYTAGYVAAPGFGYVRFPHLKRSGDRKGGRAFFLRPDADLDAVVAHLESSVLLVDEIGTIHPDRAWKE